MSLMLTNTWHHWFWIEGHWDPQSGIAVFSHGPAFYFGVLWQFGCLLALSVFLFWHWSNQKGIDRRNSSLISLSLLLPVFPYVLYLIWPSIPIGIQLWPLTMSLSGLLTTWLVLEQQERYIRERTMGMVYAVQGLKTEIAHRQKIEDELRQTKDHLANRVVEQRRNLAGLYDIILVASQVDDLQNLLQVVVERIVSAFDAEAACVHQVEAGSAVYMLSASSGLDDCQRTCLQRIPESWLQAGQSSAALPGLAERLEMPQALRISGFSAALCAALPERLEQEYSILSVFWKEAKLFSVEEIELFGALTTQMGLVIEIFYLRRQTEMSAVQKERRRLARDLHDSVTQSLHSLTLSAYSASTRLQQERYDRLGEALQNISEGARQALREMRWLLYEMRLEPLEKINLVDALRMRLEAVEQRSGIDAQLIVDIPVGWPKTWEGDLYSIAMESLNNAIKHAFASQVRVILKSTPGELILEVSDNGRGFDLLRKPDGGMGLGNMRERAERLNGKLLVDTAHNRGTRILVSVPRSGNGIV